MLFIFPNHHLRIFETPHPMLNAFSLTKVLERRRQIIVYFRFTNVLLLLVFLFYLHPTLYYPTMTKQVNIALPRFFKSHVKDVGCLR